MSGTPIARRGVLAAAAVLAAPGAAALAEAPDPVLGLFARLAVLQARTDQNNREASAIRERIVRRRGPPQALGAGRHSWDGDPDHPKLRRLLQNEHDWAPEMLRLHDEILVTPPTSLAGARAVAAYGVSQLPRPEDEFDAFHEELTRALLGNLAAFLGADCAGRPA